MPASVSGRFFQVIFETERRVADPLSIKFGTSGNAIRQRGNKACQRPGPGNHASTDSNALVPTSGGKRMAMRGHQTRKLHSATMRASQMRIAMRTWISSRRSRQGEPSVYHGNHVIYTTPGNLRKYRTTTLEMICLLWRASARCCDTVFAFCHSSYMILGLRPGQFRVRCGRSAAHAHDGRSLIVQKGGGDGPRNGSLKQT